MLVTIKMIRRLRVGKDKKTSNETRTRKKHRLNDPRPASFHIIEHEARMMLRVNKSHELPLNRSLKPDREDSRTVFILKATLG